MCHKECLWHCQGLYLLRQHPRDTTAPLIKSRQEGRGRRGEGGNGKMEGRSGPGGGGVGPVAALVAILNLEEK